MSVNLPLSHQPCQVTVGHSEHKMETFKLNSWLGFGFRSTCQNDFKGFLMQFMKMMAVSYHLLEIFVLGCYRVTTNEEKYKIHLMLSTIFFL